MANENYILLERTELNASAASVTFSNIPQTGYTDLKIVMSARGTGSLVYDTTKVTFNGNAANYSTRYIQGSGSAASSGTSGASTYIELIDEGGNATASTFGNSEFYIPNYTGSAFKSVSSDVVTETNATTVYMRLSAALWSNTAAITSITLTPDASAAYAAGSTFSLYGIAALGTTPVIAPRAIGGNIIDFDGTNWIHTFTSSGTFTPLQGLTCQYLVVAGGGGGGGGAAGGGGGGGYRSSIAGESTGGGGTLETALSLSSATNYTVTVGAGGVGEVTNNNAQTNGVNSTFHTITSTGGGFGGAFSHSAAIGGSGGGGSDGQNPTSTGANGTTNQGFAGGNGSNNGSTNYVGGGGGGAGGAGGTTVSGNGGVGGAGGLGVSSSVTGTSVSRGGGGGGNGYSTGTGTGGTGNGGGGNGAGSSSGASTSGAVNRGGGGGGGTAVAPNQTGGAGGSGIVIIRYPAA